MTNERDSDTYVQSLARGLSVIRAFGAGQTQMTLSEVAAAAAITRAGARRVLLTLQSLGYVTLEDRHFRLTAKILTLGYSFLGSLEFWSVAEPVMQALVERVGESCSASVLDGDDIVYVLRVPTRRIIGINLAVGSRLPAYVASMGRILLAALSRCELDEYLRTSTRRPYTDLTLSGEDDLRAAIASARDRGWCVVDQELEEGLRSIAVPLRNRSGRVVAALNISAHASRVSLDRMVSDLLPELLRAVVEIDHVLRLQT